MRNCGVWGLALAGLLTGCATAPTACLPAAAPSAAGVNEPASSPAAVALPPASSTDAALTQALIGSWIVPQDSSDFRRTPVREVYRADGTMTLYTFDTPACGKVLGQVDAEWHVERGLLIEKVTRVSTGQFGRPGDLSADQIMALDGATLTLRATASGPFGWSLGNPVFSRRKADGCFDAAARG